VTLSPTAVARLKTHEWRGNIRELFNVLERAVILAGGGVISPAHLLLEEEIHGGSEQHEQKRDQTGIRDPQLQTPAPPVPSLSSPAPEKEYIRAGISVQEMEEILINKTLLEVQNNRMRAAKLLGISVRTLRNKLKLYKSVCTSGALSETHT
jgi:DNA-binding NtrC family response regulator